MALKQYLDPTGLAELISKIKSLFVAKSSITTGTANGTINVAGSDVAVKGLGSNIFNRNGARSILGEFTVNANGDRVGFSTGNLQYKASTGEWRFALNQWDAIREGNVNISPTYDGWIDLFGYGCNGVNNGQPAYHPYNISTTEADYLNIDLTDIKDWGYVYGQQNGGDWRTLTKDEWLYLLFTRSGDRLAKVQIDGQYNCLIIFPDGYTSTLTNVNMVEAEFTDNLLTIVQAEVLMCDGCVILPCGFNRVGTFLNLVEFGEYFASDVTTSKTNAFFVRFNNTAISVTNAYLEIGRSVRLVQNLPYLKKSDITTGTTNDTINVAGSDVAINFNLQEQAAVTTSENASSLSLTDNGTISTLNLTGSGAHTITITSISQGYAHYVLVHNDVGSTKRIMVVKDNSLTQTLLFPSSISANANGYVLLRIIATSDNILVTKVEDIGTTQL